MLDHRIQLWNISILDLVILPAITVSTLSIHESVLLVLLVNERSGIRAKIPHVTAVGGSSFAPLISILAFMGKH